MKTDIKTDIKKDLLDLKITINRARFNLLFYIVLTIINIIFLLTQGNAIIPFSCSIATYATAFGILNSVVWLGLTISALILLTFATCYVKSKNNVLFLVAPIGIIIVDTLALIIISIITNAIASGNFLFDFIFHVVSIFYLIKAIKAYKMLGDFNTVSDAAVVEAQDVDNDNDEDLEDDETYDNELAQPIGKYEDDGTEPLLNGKHEGLHVFTVIRNGTAELVVNNYVCDTLEVTYLTEFELKAIVNNISFSFQYSQDTNSEAMFLYADETLLDSINRLI
ncbi:MAG: hypothetical protein J6Q89_09280 [Clostridia bacterium]|nr:hypothetical protein [Clostridia bacterium]